VHCISRRVVGDSYCYLGTAGHRCELVSMWPAVSGRSDPRGRGTSAGRAGGQDTAPGPRSGGTGERRAAGARKISSITASTAVAAGRGGEGEAALCSSDIFFGGGAKIWNYETCPLLANWRLHCRTDSAGTCIKLT